MGLLAAEGKEEMEIFAAEKQRGGVVKASLSRSVRQQTIPEKIISSFVTD